eukprot:scaffold74522_cov70-Phaeocystis_antarctica.AAC.1
MVLLNPGYASSLAARSTFYASPVAGAEAASDPPESAGATYSGSDLRLRLRLRVSGTGDISCLIVFSASQRTWTFTRLDLPPTSVSLC